MANDIHATVSQLNSAAKCHLKSYKDGEENISRLLLLFYSVECGLKYLYLTQHHRNSTTDFISLPIKSKYGHSHDLMLWIKDLKIPGSGYKDVTGTEKLVTLHERLRYGTFQRNVTGTAQIKFLKALSSHITRKI